MMHALGFYHEHSRPDQNSYITVNYNNIHPDHHRNFEPKEPGSVNLYNTEYSYESVMHYGRKVNKKHIDVNYSGFCNSLIFKYYHMK